MTYLELLLCISLIFFSAYLSASEIALFSLSKFQIRFLKENFRPIHRKVKSLLSDPSGLLITILVITELLNICLSTLITDVLSRQNFYSAYNIKIMPKWVFNTIIGLLVTAPILLVLCEITPKVIAVRLNQVIAILVSSSLIFIYNLAKPIRYILKKATSFLHYDQTVPPTTEGGDKTESDPILKESDFLLMLEEGHKEGAIQENELELIKNVFDLDNTTVADVSTPLSQVLSISARTTVTEALNLMRTQRYSRIPVTGRNKNEVVGILYSKDLIRSKLGPKDPSLTVAELMRKPFFVSPTMKLNGLFRKFKQQKTHMAIIRSIDGQIVGVITMSDILDVLFEDFFHPQTRTSL